MISHILKDSNWKDVKNVAFELIVLPWGATEAHNYHLPYGTDIYEADAIAAEAARKATELGGRISVLPTIPFGVNTGQSDITLDINLNPSTQLAILNDIAATLSRQGFKKLLILNSHGGNNFKPLVREVGLHFPSLFISFCNWFQSLDKEQFFEYYQGDHADEMETSLMLYLQPGLVKMDQAGDGKSKRWQVEALNESWAWAERKWSKVSEDTGIGNPHLSTAIKGKNYFNAVTDKVADLMIGLCKMDQETPYI